VARIFLAPYISPSLESREDGGCSKPFSALHDLLLKREWPYDYGDDPAFFSNRQFKGGVTWGVCRADVRSQIQPEDVVVFFSFTKSDTRTTYKLCAVATVKAKITQSEIFVNPEYALYRDYLNLLVRPSKTDNVWVHYEPGAPKDKWHKDWLGRIAPHRVYPIEELKRLGRSSEIRVGAAIDGIPFRFGQNYVIFSSDERLTAIVQHPLTVAGAQPPEAEKWRHDPLSRELYSRTIAVAQQHGVHRSLRIENKTQHAHSPAIRWKVSPEELSAWRADLLGFLKANALL
jgi:hypothetical protein